MPENSEAVGFSWHNIEVKHNKSLKSSCHYAWSNRLVYIISENLIINNKKCSSIMPRSKISGKASSKKSPWKLKTHNREQEISFYYAPTPKFLEKCKVRAHIISKNAASKAHRNDFARRYLRSTMYAVLCAIWACPQIARCRMGPVPKLHHVRCT